MAIRSHLRSKKGMEVNDLGLDGILRELNKADHSYTKVGYPAEVDVESGSKKGSEREPSVDISEVAEIALWNEFGTVNQEPRPFVRTSFDENLQTINTLKEKLYKQITAGTMTAKRALAIVGEAHVNQMKRKIRDIKEPANKPSTRAKKKGVNNPLIDTAQMLNSTQHVEMMNVRTV